MKKKNDDKKNLLCVNGWYYLRALVHGATIKQALGTKELEIAQKKRDKILNELKLTDNRIELLEHVQIQLIGEEEKRKMLEKENNLGMKLCDILDFFLNEPSRHETCKQTDINYINDWKMFNEWMINNHPDVQFSHQMTRTIGREWVNWLKLTYNSSGTCAAKFTHINYIWKKVCMYDDNLINPFYGISCNLKKNNGKRKEPFTDEEMRLIFSTENNIEFRLMSGFLFYLTLRWSEACNLQWSQIKDGYFNGCHTKTGADATTRIPKQLFELIQQIPENERTGYIFKSYCGKRTNEKYIDQLQKLGIQTSIEIPTKNGGTRHFCIKGAHSFRHRAITDALINGNSSSAVRRLAGHATENMQRRYTHMDADVAGDVSESLGKFW